MADTTAKPPPLPFTERPSLAIFVDYLLTTATHGLRNIGTAYSKLYRTFWIITFLAAFGLMLYFVISCVLQYLAYPTQTNVEIEAQRDMLFPAVTVCNANAYRVDKFMAALAVYAQQIGSNLTGPALESLSFPLIGDLFNRNELATLNSLSFQLENMLLDCSYNGINCSSSFVRSTSSVLGNCFTFNWNASMKKLFTLNDIGSTLVLFSGLTLTFYLPRHLNFPIAYFDDGLIVLLHDNDELPLTAQNGLRLQPGLAHTINYKKSQAIFLPTPYTNCTSAAEADLRALYQTTFNSEAVSQVAYSEPVCNELCQQAYIFSQCSCILPIPFFTRHVFNREHDYLVVANVCQPSTSQEICALNAAQELAASPTLTTTWCSHCVPQCTYTYFSTDLSTNSAPTAAQKAFWAPLLLSNASNWTNLALPGDFTANYDAYMSSNYLRVTVTCGSRYVTINRQEAKLTIVDTFAAIGGQTGL